MRKDRSRVLAVACVSSFTVGVIVGLMVALAMPDTWWLRRIVYRSMPRAEDLSLGGWKESLRPPFWRSLSFAHGRLETCYMDDPGDAWVWPLQDMFVADQLLPAMMRPDTQPADWNAVLRAAAFTGNSTLFEGVMCREDPGPDLDTEQSSLVPMSERGRFAMVKALLQFARTHDMVVNPAVLEESLRRARAGGHPEVAQLLLEFSETGDGSRDSRAVDR